MHCFFKKEGTLLWDFSKNTGDISSEILLEFNRNQFFIPLKFPGEIQFQKFYFEVLADAEYTEKISMDKGPKHYIYVGS